MATYLAKKRPGPLYLEDGRAIAYNTEFLAGESGFPALSGSDLIAETNGQIVLVSGDPGPAPSDLVRVNVDKSTGLLYDADADPDEDDPILDPNSVVTAAELLPLVGSQAVKDMLTNSVMTGHTVGTPVTGLTTGSEAAAALSAFNTLSGGAYTSGQITKTEPLYADPAADPTYRISGPFKYLYDSTAQQVGTWIISRSAATPTGGSTGNSGQSAWSLPSGSRYFLLRLRDIGSGSTTQRFRCWASKDEGPLRPFRSLASQAGNEEFPSPGDGNYQIVPFDLGASGEWTVVLDAETATFGGIWTLTDHLPMAPLVRAPKGLFIGDSFTVPGQGQFRHSLGYIPRLARLLGVEWHLSGQGGTGYRARGNVGDNANYNYAERLALDVDPYFDDDDQPAVIVVQASQNDRTYGWAGTSELDANIAAVLGGLRGRFPNVPIYATGIMHTRSESFNDEYFQIENQIQAYIEAHPEQKITYVPGLLREGISAGTGYMGATTGTGNSDTATWTDGSHASPLGGTEPTGATLISNQLSSVATTERKQLLQVNAGYKLPAVRRLTSTIGARYAHMPASGNHTHSDPVAVSQLPAELLASRRLVHTAWEQWTGTGTTMTGALQVAADYTAAMWPGGSVAFGADGSALAAYYIDPADWEVTGKTLRFYTRLTCVTNATNPFRTITSTMVAAGTPAGATGGHLNIPAGTSVTGSTAQASANVTASKIVGVSSAFAIATAGEYMPSVAVAGGGLPANAVIRLRWMLYAVNV